MELRHAVERQLDGIKNLSTYRALDFGCGAGYFSNYFARLGCSVKWVDIDSYLVAKAAAAYPGIEFEVALAQSLKRTEYDLAFMNMVVCNIGGANELLDTFLNVKESLKKGGAIFITSIDVTDDCVNNDNVRHVLPEGYRDGAPLLVS